MPTTFLHTADWQIGKPFARIGDVEKRTLVRQERIRAIAKLGAVAREKGAAFILVAGDLFDSPTVARATVSQACGVIGELGIPVLVIPGNHDHGGPGCLWEQDFFQRERGSLAPNMRVLLEAEPVVLEDAVIFPCPLLRRHEASDPTAWLRGMGEGDVAEFGSKPRIVLAHGSTQDFEGGGDEEEASNGVPNLIDLGRLPEGVFDYVALGDWHGMKQVGARAWYAGTPERDRFPKGPGNNPGNVLVVGAERGVEPQVEPVETGRLGWHEIGYTFSGDGDVEVLRDRIEQLVKNRAAQDLLRLELRGSLGIEATGRLEELLEVWAARLLRLKLSDETVIAPTPEEVEGLTRRAGDPLIASVAAKLVGQLEGKDEEAAVAHIALRELYAAVMAASRTN